MNDDAPACGPDAPESAPRRRGRPRSEQAEQAILDTTVRLITEHQSVASVTVEAVAQAAGVGKATIYRRWPSKEALIIAAVGSVELPLPELPGTSVRDDLIVLMESLRRQVLQNRADALLGPVMAEVRQHPALAEIYHQVVVERRREAVRAVLRRGAATGELRADLPIDLMMDILVAPFVLLKMLGNQRAPAVDPDMPRAVVDATLQGLAGASAGCRETVPE